MASKAAKAHWMRRSRNNKSAASRAKGAAKQARLMIAHGYELLAKHGKKK